MRLWSIHPIYLDYLRLGGAWHGGLSLLRRLQEHQVGHGLLIVAHGQAGSPPDRWLAQPDPVGALQRYLLGLYLEVQVRRAKGGKAYAWDGARIGLPIPELRYGTPISYGRRITVTEGQVLLELELLRGRQWDEGTQGRIELPRRADLSWPALHPLFTRVPGPVESWERVTPAPAPTRTAAMEMTSHA